MTIDEKLEALYHEQFVPQKIDAKMLAWQFGAHLLREAATRASILDYDPELVAKALREFADLAESKGKP